MTRTRQLGQGVDTTVAPQDHRARPAARLVEHVRALCRMRRPAFSGFGALVVLVLGPSLAPSSVGVTRSASIPLGVYAGPRNPAGVARFAAATGTHPSLATEFLDGADGWPGLVNVSGLEAWRSSGYTLVLAVPLLPRHATNSLAAGARGAYNGRFATLAHNLVSEGFGDAYLRLGWEFNGSWYKWRVHNASSAANFANFFRNVVISMRSVPGQSFRFVWNPNDSGPSSYSPDQAYPGNAYVDYVGSDVYANCWCRPFTAPNGWAAQLSQPWGLNWLASFAAEMGKPVVFPEWGVDYRSDGHGLGDDPYFVDHFAAWVDAHDVAWTSTFAYDGSHRTDTTDITDGTFPNSLAAFRADFG